MRRKMIVWFPVAAALTALASAVLAHAFPARPVQIVVPYPPGGPTDNLARALAARLGDIWSQQVVVENKPGGNTLIGAQFVAKASADGHTMMLPAEATLVINPARYAKLPYDPQKISERGTFRA